MGMTYQAKHKVFFPGWRMVLLSGIGLSLSIGPMMVLTFGVYAKQLGASFLSNRASISMSVTLLNIAVAVGSPIAGRLIDRFGARIVIVLSMTGLSICLFGLSVVEPPLWHLWALFALAGLFGAGSHPVAFCRVIANWFDHRRGLALGLTSAGIGVGGLLLPVLSQILIEKAGWRHGYLILGGMCLFIATPLILFFLKDKPEDMDLVTDGFPDSNRPVKPPAISIGEALRTRTFWMLCFVFLCVAVCGIGLITHLPLMLTDRGITGRRAAMAASLFGAFTSLGRLGNGYLIDKFFAPYVAAVSILGAAIGLAILWSGVGGSFVFIGVALMGFAVGAEGDIMPYLLSRYFGKANMGTLFGIGFSAFTIGAAIGPYFLGKLFDITGSYRIPLAYATVLMLIAMIITLLLKNYDRTKWGAFERLPTSKF